MLASLAAKATGGSAAARPSAPIASSVSTVSADVVCQANAGIAARTVVDADADLGQEVEVTRHAVLEAGHEMGQGVVAASVRRLEGQLERGVELEMLVGPGADD